MPISPRISIIIPTYNGAKYMPVSLNSVLLQSYKNYEIIVVDDGSTDDTKKVVDTFMSKSPCIKYIYKENEGRPSLSRNVGIQNARGQYTVFLDHDDFYTPDSLMLRMKAIEAFNNAKVVIGKRKILHAKDDYGSTETSFLRKYKKAVISQKDIFSLCNSNIFFKIAINKGFFVHTNAIMYDTAYLKQLGMFDGQFLITDDIDLWFRTFYDIDQFVYVDEILSGSRVYFITASSSIKKRYIDERRRYLKHISMLNSDGYEKKMIKILKKRICAKKYKYIGILNYRKGNILFALKNYCKSLYINVKDLQTIEILLKSLIPTTIKGIYKRIAHIKKN